MRFYRVYHRINSNLSHFAASMLEPANSAKLIDTTVRNSLTLQKHNLSRREIGRLQRALCHYAIHCELLNPRASHAGVFLPDNIANLGLARFEAEEVMHVRKFMENQYCLLFGELESSFALYLTKQARKDIKTQPEVPRYPAKQLVGENWEAFPYLEQFSRRYDDNGDQQDKPHCVAKYTHFLADLGLDFLHHLLRVPSARRTDFIIETMVPILSLPKQTVQLRRDDAPAIPKNSPRRVPNGAWLVLSKKGSSSRQREGLRRYGWVFWDAPRLRAMHLDTRTNMLAASHAPLAVWYKARWSADIPALADATFRRLFWVRRVKKDWGVNDCASERELEVVLGWVDQIRASGRLTADQWFRDLQLRRAK